MTLNIVVSIINVWIHLTPEPEPDHKQIISSVKSLLIVVEKI